MADVDLVGKCSSEQFSTLVHKIIDKLLGRRGPLYQDYSNVWSLDEWWKVNDWFRDICRACVRQNMNKEEVFGLLGDLSEMYKDIFVSVISAQRDELWQAQLCETTANLGSYLKDFDWKLKLVLSSDKLATIREPLVSVQFYTQNSEGGCHLDLELNKEELKHLIVSLEAANKVVMQLKV